MTRKVTLVAVVAMLAMGTSAAFALGATPGTTDDAAMAQETTTMPAEQTTTVAAQTANVTFADQTSNGTAVVVEQVVVPEGGFVVIHEAQRATGMETTTTQPGTTAALDTTIAGTQTTQELPEQQYTAGAVLGNSTYLEPGVHENVTVHLNQPLTESQVLIAMPHLDTNDNQQYEFPEADDPYVAEDGAVIDWAQVTVEEMGNQTTTAAGAETTTEEM